MSLNPRRRISWPTSESVPGSQTYPLGNPFPRISQKIRRIFWPTDRRPTEIPWRLSRPGTPTGRRPTNPCSYSAPSGAAPSWSIKILLQTEEKQKVGWGRGEGSVWGDLGILPAAGRQKIKKIKKIKKIGPGRWPGPAGPRFARPRHFASHPLARRARISPDYR